MIEPIGTSSLCSSWAAEATGGSRRQLPRLAALSHLAGTCRGAICPPDSLGRTGICCWSCMPDRVSNAPGLQQGKVLAGQAIRPWLNLLLLLLLLLLSC